MPAWPRAAYACFALSSVVNIGSVLLAAFSPLSVLRTNSGWSYLFLAPLAFTAVAAPFVGLRWGGPLGRALVGGLVMGIVVLAIVGMLVAAALPGTPQD